MLRLPTFGLALVATLGCSQATKTAAPVASTDAAMPVAAAPVAVEATVTTVALEVPGMT